MIKIKKLFRGKKAVLPDAFIYMGLTIMLFWLIFPLGMLLLNGEAKSPVTTTDLDNVAGKTKLTNPFDTLGLYFKYLFADIPNVSPIILYVKYALEIASIFFIFAVISDALTSLSSIIKP